MDLTASFSLSWEDLMPDLVICDYTYVESIQRALEELGLEPDSEPDSAGWMVIGRMHSILHHNDDQFSDIEEDDEGYKCFGYGVDVTLTEARSGLIEGFSAELAEQVKHKINGSTEEFEAALEQES